ncbi:type II secretion system F family protein [Undibacterium sp. 14-3-2]|uniref:type II secretion system F family protein n=1 Tax=Undibacterium sp. 14-3-2 TaxID=2800129 RepID=UPI001906E65B|nr:type II secretion system F family protein [Undibacterium sp. 14-3-2]MBK1890235.1 type II secretion system F family protein [Undibacterium sp. 14-3-2]
MPEFRYQATDAQGAVVKGVLTVEDQTEAMTQLQRRGLMVFEIQEVAASRSSRISQPKRAGRDAILVVLQELATLLDAGVTLADAVENVARGYQDSPLGLAFNKIYSQLRGGIAFSKALIDVDLRLPNYVVELCRAGESTGKLAGSLRSAAEQLELEQNFQREARNALIYPMVLIVSGFLATLLVFVFVVPKFANILSNPKADIPTISLWVLATGMWLTKNKLLLGTLLAGVAGSAFALLRQEKVQQNLWNWAAGLPVIGSWIMHTEMARWSSMFSVLLQNHVSILEALAHAQNALRGDAWRQKAALILSDVRGGKTLAESLQLHQFIDATGVNLVRVGERSGALGKTTASLAQMHRMHSQQQMRQFLILLEPVTILLVSVVLGGIMISVMLAITSLTNVI